MMNRQDEIDRLIDGELTDKEYEDLIDAARIDPALADEIAGARQVASMLADARDEAPPSLSARLSAIPDRQQRSVPLRWFAVAASLALVTVTVTWTLYRNEETELARAEQDLQVAIYYLKKINTKTSRAVGRSLDRGAIEPLVDVVTGQL